MENKAIEEFILALYQTTEPYQNMKNQAYTNKFMQTYQTKLNHTMTYLTKPNDTRTHRIIP